MAATCTPAGLNVACFSGIVLDNLRRKALFIYFLAQDLKLSGGTDYTSALTSSAAGGLLGDTVSNFSTSSNTDGADLYGQRIIGLYELGLMQARAVLAGYAKENINTLMAKIPALLSVPERTMEKMILYLQCQLANRLNG